MPDASRVSRDNGPVTQPGYDELAELYAETFPSPYPTALERYAVRAFADLVPAGGDGVVVDVGCGPGDVTADLAGQGLPVVGVDPSARMLDIARRKYPEREFLADDAYLAKAAATVEIAAILARFSLIHVPPKEIPDVFGTWAERLKPGGIVLVAGQALDGPSVDAVEFDHKVARAWLWHPDRLAETLNDAGFDEVWRIISRRDAEYRFRRFPEVHLVARRRS